MKALVIGATGATGKDLVAQLLADTRYTAVIIFVRRPGHHPHPKFTEVITDFDQLERIADQVHGDVLFSCLGTTLAAAGSKEQQQHIDLEIPLAFARLARANGLRRCVLLSAYGASPTSNVFYSRLKGELEAGYDALSLEQYIIFRPGLLLRKNTDRRGEQIFATILHLLNRIGILRKFKPLPTALLAQKMIHAQQTLPPGKHILELSKIFEA